MVFVLSVCGDLPEGFTSVEQAGYDMVCTCIVDIVELFANFSL